MSEPNEPVGVITQPKGVAVIGYSIVAQLANDRHITFQHFIASDADDKTVNADLDRIMRLVDRQKAMREIPDLKAQRQKLQNEISQYNEDAVTQAQANFERAQADLDVQAAELNKLYGEKRDAAYQKWVTEGRRGEFEPRGQTKAELARIDDGLKQVEAQKAKNVAEKSTFEQETSANIKRRQDLIGILDEQIADLEKSISDADGGT